MTRRSRLRSLLLAVVALVAVAAVYAPPIALGQTMVEGMGRSGTAVRIQNEGEKKLFAKLLCMCGGCQREALSECTCGYADTYRDEVRAMLAQGLTPEQINSEWVKRFGPQALAVPPNTGANRFLYLVPLAAIAGMAVVVIVVLRRFRKGSGGPPDGPAPPAGGGADDYDAKLDEELKQLDNE